MKYTTVTQMDVIYRIKKDDEPVFETTYPTSDKLKSWTEDKMKTWVSENNKRMTAICDFLNSNNL